MIGRSAPTRRLRVLVRKWREKLNSSRFPKDIDGEQNHFGLDRVLVAREWLHHVIRNGINQQKADEEKRPGLALADRQPKPGKRKYCWKQKCHVASNPQIVSRDDVDLRRADPEIAGALQAEEKKSSGVITNKLFYFSLLFLHETHFPKLLKSAH